MSERRRFFAPFDDETPKKCGRCGETRPLREFVTDENKRMGHGSICKLCDREKSREYYAAHRQAVLARAAARRPPAPARKCEECGGELEGRQRVVCGRRCAEARYRRLHPVEYAAKERRKYERRKAREQ
jgi:hypothetical protein